MIKDLEEQMSILRMADYEGLPLRKYVNRRFTAREMLVILDGLRQGIDVSVFADNKFNYKQMYEIMDGIIKGIDVSILLNQDITWKEMEYLKNLISRGVDVRPYIEDHLTPNQLYGVSKILDSANPEKVLPMAKSFNYDVVMIDNILKFDLSEGDLEGLKDNLYGLNWSFEPEQLAVIQRASILGYPIVNYAYPEMRVEELEEIAHACEEGIDVRHFALPGYTSEQMKFIERCIKDGIDVTYILKPDLSLEEMQGTIE